MKIDRNMKKNLKKKYPSSVLKKALKEAENKKELEELLNLYMKAYNRTILLNYNPEKNFNSGGTNRSCFM